MSGSRYGGNTEKESACNRIPGIPQLIGVGEVAGEPVPIRQVKFGLTTVNDCLAERDRETDCRILERVVVRIVVHNTPKVIGVQFDLVEKGFSSAGLIEISFRWPYGQLDGAAVKACSCRGTRQQHVFKRWGPEFSVVRIAQSNDVGGSKVLYQKPRAYRLH